MNKLFKRSLLVLALFSQGAYANIDDTKEACNASEGLDGWAIWCGVDTYLAQQEPPAAGPVGAGDGGLVPPGVLTDPTLEEELAIVTPVEPPPTEPPIVPPVVEVEYNWEGYAMLAHRDLGTLQTGELKLRLVPETGEVLAELTTSLGEVTTFNLNGKFFAAGESLPLLSSSTLTETTNPLAGGSPISQFEVTSENGQLKLVTFPQDWRMTILGYNFEDSTDVSAFGELAWEDELVYGHFAAGSLTPLANMADLAARGVEAQYRGSGIYSGYGRVDNNIAVNFGNASWNGTWNGLGITAAGGIDGNKFSANSIIGGEIAASSSIKGAFNGPDASSLIGGMDIQRGEEQIVGVFKNTKLILNTPPVDTTPR